MLASTGAADPLGFALPLGAALPDGAALPLAFGVGVAVAVGEAVGVPLAPGAALAPGLALALADGEADSDGSSVAALLSGVDESTLRNRSSAGATSLFSVSWSTSPATLMTMLEVPSVTTSGSETPEASTRSAMIWRACSSFTWSGALPPGSVAASVSVVPPRRSRPRFGLGFLSPVKNTNA